MSSPSSPPSSSSACEIGRSPSTRTRGAGTTGSMNTSIIPPDRQGFCTVTTPRSASPPNGTIRSSSGSPPSIVPFGGEAERGVVRSEEHTSELQSHVNLVCRLLLEKKKKREQN